MKVLINDYGELLPEVPRQEIDATGLIEFVTDDNTRFRVSANEKGDGITVSVKRIKGWDQLQVLPKFSNQIEII